MERVKKCKIYLKCALCSKRAELGVGCFFMVPIGKAERRRWSLACETKLEDKDRVCSDHFSPNDIIWKGSKASLAANAIPLPLPPTQSAGKNNSSSLIEGNTNEPVVINEALFDDNEIPIQHSNIADHNTDITVNPLRLSIDIKIEDDAIMQSIPDARSLKTNFDKLIPVSVLKAEKRDNREVIKLPISKSIQTDESSKNSMNCGFVNVSKSGKTKYFNLRCFYCDAEYPISAWTEFSHHILRNHRHLENKYNQTDENEYSKCDKPSITTKKKTKITKNHTMDVSKRPSEEQQTNITKNDLVDVNESEEDEPINIINNNIIDISDSATEEELPSMDLIKIEDSSSPVCLSPVVKSSPESDLIKIVPEFPNSIDDEYMYVEKYVPQIDHSYTQGDLIICIYKTPYRIMCDFLDHFKGHPALWYERKLNSEKYDNELLNLMHILKLKWDLNLRMIPLHKDLEKLKAWFFKTRSAEIRYGYINDKHYEYYEKCSEFLLLGDGSRHDYECDICQRSLPNVIHLQVHKYRKHKIGDLPYRCSKCIFRFTNINNLLKHLKKHTPKKTVNEEEPPPPPPSPSQQTFECFVCDQLLHSDNEYKLHLDIHPQGDRPFGCDKCGKRYKMMAQLNVHRKTHTRPGYQCQYCQKKLSTSVQFKYHMNSHRGVYEYVCEWCGRGFVNSSSYKEHTKFVHLGHGLCKICNREYKKRSILMKHLRNLHRPLIGSIEELTRSHKLRARKRRSIDPKYRKYEYILDPVTQKRRLKCPLCDLNYLRHQSLQVHALKVHNFDIRTLKRPKKAKTVNENNNSTWKKVKLIKEIAVNRSHGEEDAVAAISHHTARSDIVQFENPNKNFEDSKMATGITSNDMLEIHSQTKENLVTKVEDYGMSELAFTFNAMQ